MKSDDGSNIEIDLEVREDVRYSETDLAQVPSRIFENLLEIVRKFPQEKQQARDFNDLAELIMSAHDLATHLRGQKNNGHPDLEKVASQLEGAMQVLGVTGTFIKPA